jgi:hypothetical protein
MAAKRCCGYRRSIDRHAPLCAGLQLVWALDLAEYGFAVSTILRHVSFLVEYREDKVLLHALQLCKRIHPIGKRDCTSALIFMLLHGSSENLQVAVAKSCP